MDIRQAKSFVKNPAGTIINGKVTAQKPQPSLPHIDDQTGTAVDPLEQYGGDAVISQYMEFLKEHDITEDDIQNVLSSIIHTGNVRWDFLLFDQIPVAFQIRPTWVNDYILELIDQETIDSGKVSMLRFNNLTAVYNLAGSLVLYDKETFEVKTKEDFLKMHDRVRQFSYIVQNSLVNKLAVFDRTVAVAVSDWAIKNFTKAQKAK